MSWFPGKLGTRLQHRRWDGQSAHWRGPEHLHHESHPRRCCGAGWKAQVRHGCSVRSEAAYVAQTVKNFQTASWTHCRRSLNPAERFYFVKRVIKLHQFYFQNPRHCKCCMMSPQNRCELLKLSLQQFSQNITAVRSAAYQFSVVVDCKSSSSWSVVSV